MVLSGDKRHKFTHDYNIFKNMKCPALLGTPSNVTAYNVLKKTSDNLLNYAMAYPAAGVNTTQPYGSTIPTANGPFYSGRDYSMGSNYFVPLGKCSDDSENNCAGKTRWVYLRNIPTGKIPLLGNINFKDVVGCDIPGITEGRCLIPGMLEDISDIQPLNLFANATGGGNYGGMKCKKIKLPVGSHIYDGKMKCSDPTFRNCDNSSWWIEDKCSPSYKYTKEILPALPKIPGVKPLGAATETFTNPTDVSSTPSSSSSLFLISSFFGLLFIYIIYKLFIKKV